MQVLFTGTEAISNLRQNPERGWMKASSDRSANERLSSGDFLDISHKPKFALERDWPIFTLGSCFAREVENALIGRGMRVLTEGHGVEGQYYASWNEKTGIGGGVGPSDISRGALNKYTVRSMLDEIKWALEGSGSQYGGLLELKEDTWFDPNSSGLRNLDYETTLANRRKIEASTKTIKDAKVVLITLGLTETWLDSVSGQSMNVHPGVDWLKRLQNRFYFVDYGFEDTIAQIREIIQLVCVHCSEDMKFVLTVSPVPLSVTFKNMDIVVANNGSKSMLRAVAEEVSRQYDFVDYFPSYEMVTFSPRAKAFEEDGVHVRPELVRRIMDKFISAYYAVP